MPKRLAHRVIYELVVGDIPPDMQLDHLCGVTNCCQPEHLESVTCAENIRRRDRGIQARKDEALAELDYWMQRALVAEARLTQ